MARKRERIFAGFFAGLFILTSSALTIVVLVTMFTQNKQTANNDAQAKALAELQKKQQQQQQNPQPKLQGTLMANFTPVATVSGLEKTDLAPGTGATVKAGQTITVDYTGALASTGVVFESSKDTGQPATFPLDQVIAGWSQGIPGMKVGGTRRLVIPASMAYGSKGQSGIPPNSNLVFDVTVTKVDK